jgi:hypothetical protein
LVVVVAELEMKVRVEKGLTSRHFANDKVLIQKVANVSLEIAQQGER